MTDVICTSTAPTLRVPRLPTHSTDDAAGLSVRTHHHPHLCPARHRKDNARVGLGCEPSGSLRGLVQHGRAGERSRRPLRRAHGASRTAWTARGRASVGERRQQFPRRQIGQIPLGWCRHRRRARRRSRDHRSIDVARPQSTRRRIAFVAPLDHRDEGGSSVGRPAPAAPGTAGPGPRDRSCVRCGRSDRLHGVVRAGHPGGRRPRVGPVVRGLGGCSVPRGPHDAVRRCRDASLGAIGRERSARSSTF